MRSAEFTPILDRLNTREAETRVDPVQFEARLPLSLIQRDDRRNSL
jgi:hypothetical protein